jgi:hypothetical protein
MNELGRFTVPWKQVIRNFFQRELLSVLFWSSMGAIVAALVRALMSDNAFDAFLITTYLPPQSASTSQPATFLSFSPEPLRS